MTTLVLTTQLMGELEQAARRDVEVAGVLLVRIVEGPDGNRRLLGRRIRWVPEQDYLEQDANGLMIRSTGYVDALAEAERNSETAIWFHTHPGCDAIPTPSEHDFKVDEQISELFRIRTGSAYYGTLILSPRMNGCAFSGSVHHEEFSPEPIERLWIVGDRWRLYREYNPEAQELDSIFDRNVRAFGPAIQQTLSELRVAIVGCGGTGSSVAEQLVRLGVRNFTLIDGDTISGSNVTRLYGSTIEDVGEPKADVVGRNLAKIATGVNYRSVQGMITMRAVALQLMSSDLVFGCTDDNAGRLVLSRLATYLLTPVIDMGVLLSSEVDGTLTDINGRVTTLFPGTACLVCRDRVDLQRAASELMTPEERLRLEDEGYAPTLGQTEPAVVSFTTAVAATAVAEMLERFIGFGPEPRPNEVLLRFHEREISTNVRESRERHFCHPAADKLGWGSGEPFLEQTWPEV